MDNQQSLSGYIQTGVAQGKTFEQIKIELLGSGWSVEQVELALHSVERPNLVDTKKSSINMARVIAGLVVILLVVGTGFIFFQKMTFDSAETVSTSDKTEDELGLVADGLEKVSEENINEGMDLRFIEPGPNTLVNADELIDVQLAGKGFTEILIVGGGLAETVKTSGEETIKAEIMVSRESLGTSFVLKAFGKTEEGEFVESEELVLGVSEERSFKVVELEVVSPAEFHTMKVGESVQLSVSGLWSDGQRMFVSEARFGTNYSTLVVSAEDATKQIVSISEDGLVTALDPGTINVLVSHDDPVNVVSVQIQVE